VKGFFNGALLVGTVLVSSLSLAADLTLDGSRHAVQRGLSRLIEGGKLFRVARGIYVAAVETRFGVRPPAPEKVVHSLANALGEVLVDHGARAANKLGLSTQVRKRSINPVLADGVVFRKQLALASSSTATALRSLRRC